MADGSRETDFKSFFTEFVGIQRKREQGVRMEVIPCLKSKEIPTPAGVRRPSTSAWEKNAKTYCAIMFIGRSGS